MTTKHLAILLAVLLGGMSSVWMLPRQLGYQPVGIDLRLPEFLSNGWWGHDVEITEKERTTLGHDTEFARKVYSSGVGDNVLVSIVLAGEDMMTGLHRPERCLNAQGWQVGDHSRRALDVPNFGVLNSTRLRNFKNVPDSTGVLRRIDSICYYWFVGSSEVTGTHNQRVWIDSRDRILRGYNQRWGMVLVSSEITKEWQRFGRDEAQTEAMLQGFIKQVAPKILTSSVRPR